MKKSNADVQITLSGLKFGNKIASKTRVSVLKAYYAPQRLQVEDM